MTTKERPIYALTIRQPWAHLIIHGITPPLMDRVFKSIENRPRLTYIRGRIWVHAGKSLDVFGAGQFTSRWGACLPSRDEMNFGGIIGSVEIVDCVTDHISTWFTGPYGYVIENPEPCDFIPYKGQLGFFKLEIAP